MLQQTQVKTVIPYWQRWMQELPDVATLARANPARVLKLWEGLGYYTRARNLQKAAKRIMAHHVGNFPTNFEEVLALPGVGRYTAGAICSIAFNEPTAILDGNVMRVLTRLYGIESDPRRPATASQLWALAKTLVQEAAATQGNAKKWTCSLLNQGLMELGALVCTRAAPQCELCPVRNHCMARASGRTDKIPYRKRREPALARRYVAFVIKHRGKILVRQRPVGVINAELWEFPNVELHSATTEAQLRKAARQALKVTPSSLEPLVVIKHTITRYRISLEAYRVKLNGAIPLKDDQSRWLTCHELKMLPFTSAHGKILNRI